MKLFALLVMLAQFWLSQERYIAINEFDQGMIVHLEYIAPTDGSRQAIDFYGSNYNILLHVNPRYNHNWPSLVLDTRISSRWQQPRSIRTFPFTPGEHTNITVFTNSRAFDIYANRGVFHFRYPFFRGIPLSDIVGVDHWANGNSGILQFIAGKMLPKFGTMKVVYFLGTAPRNGLFSIDLVETRPERFSMDLIHLRIGVDFHRNIVFKNSRLKTNCGLEWGDEELCQGMPFERAQPFSIAIFTKEYGYEVAVNGKHFTTCRYRAPLTEDMVVMATRVPTIQKIDYY